MDHLLNTVKRLRETFAKFRETCDIKHIYKNELDKACFTHAGYSDNKVLAQVTI